MATPKVFISYSHDSEEHKAWVFELASALVKNGIDAILDQWDIRLGSNLTQFMEQGLSGSDRVLVICTDNYNEKANGSRGGVGYEKNILTAQLLYNQDTTKFIPCVRGATTTIKTPLCLASRAYIDFSDDARFDGVFDELLRELHGVPLRPKPPLGRNPFAPMPFDAELPTLAESSTAFFEKRFGASFPGVRGIEWFREPTAAVERLSRLFSQPLEFKNAHPIWWWRNGDMHISRFEALSADTVLLDLYELTIEEIAAVNAGAYYQSFVYIKTRPSAPTGLRDQYSVDQQVSDQGFAHEEFALFRGIPVPKAAYDDGAAVINGKLVDLNGEASVRVRYLSPYNLLIAPFASPINCNEFYYRRGDLLNGILQGKHSLEQLVDEVLKLPKRRD